MNVLKFLSDNSRNNSEFLKVARSSTEKLLITASMASIFLHTRNNVLFKRYSIYNSVVSRNKKNK